MKRDLNIITRLMIGSWLKCTIQRKVVVIRNEEGNVLETYNIRKLKPYTGPAIPARARVVHEAEGQSHYFFVEEANRMEAYILERSIAGGRECSKLEGLHYWPPIHN